jgi:hypothetical protein
LVVNLQESIPQWETFWHSLQSSSIRSSGRVLYSTRYGVHWSNICQRTNELHLAHLRDPDVGGWKMQVSPRCRHGPMKPGKNNTNIAAGDAIKFSCLLKKCDPVYSKVHDTYEPVEEKKRGQKKRQGSEVGGGTETERQPRRAAKSKDNGSPGSCNCRSKCKTKGCPCHAAGLRCGPSCGHGRSAASSSRSSKPPACQNGDSTNETAAASHTGVVLSRSRKKKRPRIADSDSCTSSSDVASDDRSVVRGGNEDHSNSECEFLPE